MVPLSPHVLLNLPTAALAAMCSGLRWYIKTAQCKDFCGNMTLILIALFWKELLEP